MAALALKVAIDQTVWSLFWNGKFRAERGGGEGAPRGHAHAGSQQQGAPSPTAGPWSCACSQSLTADGTSFPCCP